MKAAKGNKEYIIDESQQKAYQDQGFDILDDDGEVIAYGRGKTVPYGVYMALKKELEELRAIIAVQEETEGEVQEDIREENPEKEAKRGKAGNQKAGE